MQPKKERKNKSDGNKSRGMVTIPYNMEGMSERIARTFKSYNISSDMKPHCILRNMLVHPKDKRDPLNTTDVIYSVPYKNCPVSYIGETGRKFGEEHRVEAEKLSTGIKTRATRKSSQSVVYKSAILDHVVDNNQLIDWDEARIIGKENDRYKRWIKEAIAIRKQGTTMNQDEGQYQLSRIWRSSKEIFWQPCC